MEEKQGIKISLSTFFLILAILVIIVMAFFMYKIYNKNLLLDKSINELNDKIRTPNSLNMMN